MDGDFPSGIALLAKRNGKLQVSDSGIIIPLESLPAPFSGMVPGRIGDPLAGYDSLYGRVGWKYVDDRDYIVYSSLDYNASGVDISGSNYNDWPIRLVDGRKTYVPDPLVRANYSPVYLSDEDMFCVFKDTDTGFDGWFDGLDGRSEPIGIELENYIYTWREGPGKDIVLFQYELHNKSNNVLDSCYLVYGYGLILIGPGVHNLFDPGLTREIRVVEKEDRSLPYMVSTMSSEWTPENWNVSEIPPTLGFPVLESPIGYDNSPAEIHEVGCSAAALCFRREKPDSIGVLFSEGNDSIAYRALSNLSIEACPCGAAPRGPVVSVGPFPMDTGSTVRVTFGIIFSDSLPHLLLMHDFITRVYNNDFKRPSPPPAPELTATALNRSVTLSWDNTAENATDIIIPDSLGRPFVGYKLLRATSRGGPYIELARWHVDTLLVYEYLDTGEDLPGGLKNNVTYYYELLSYDEGAARLKLDPMESPALEGVNFVSVIPSTEPPDTDGKEVTPEMMEGIRIVPNPYMIRHQAQGTSPAVYFNYLPSECTIRIYTIAMDLVKTIQHSGGSREEWDLTTEGGQLVASQMFIAHIEATNGIETVKKFAVVMGR